MGCVILEISSRQPVAISTVIVVTVVQHAVLARLGLSLTPVSFGIGEVRPYPTSNYQAIEEITVSAVRSNVGYMSSPEQAPAPTFDEIRYEVTVSVQFEVARPD